MKPTYQDTIEMDGMLLLAREILAESENVDAGRKVRITLYGLEGNQTIAVPVRVAKYACKAMGKPVAVQEAGEVVFYSQGIAVAWLPSLAGWRKLLLALIAHVQAGRKRGQRQLAKLQKGGGAL